MKNNMSTYGASTENDVYYESYIIGIFPIIISFVVIAYGVTEKLFGNVPINFNLFSYLVKTDLPSFVSWSIFTIAMIVLIYACIVEFLFRVFNVKPPFGYTKTNRERPVYFSDKNKNYNQNTKRRLRSKSDSYKSLEKWAILRDKKEISDEEFNEIKKKILND